VANVQGRPQILGPEHLTEAQDFGGRPEKAAGHRVADLVFDADSHVRVVSADFRERLGGVVAQAGIIRLEWDIRTIIERACCDALGSEICGEVHGTLEFVYHFAALRLVPGRERTAYPPPGPARAEVDRGDAQIVLVQQLPQLLTILEVGGIAQFHPVDALDARRHLKFLRQRPVGLIHHVAIVHFPQKTRYYRELVHNAIPWMSARWKFTSRSAKRTCPES
jgi:hypothetical protein